MVRLHYKANDFDWVEALCASEGRADKHVDELDGYEGESLFSSEGTEVDASGD